MVFRINLWRYKNAVAFVCGFGERFCCFFNCVKAAKVGTTYYREEAPAREWVYSFGQSASVRQSVYGVLHSRSLSEVSPRIVCWVPVNMIYLVIRPFIQHPHEGQPMRKVHGTKHLNLPPSLCIQRPCYSPGFGLSTPVLHPREYPSFWVIVEQCLEFFLGDFDHTKNLPRPTVRGKLFN